MERLMLFQIEKLRKVIEAYDSFLTKTAEMLDARPEIKKSLVEWKEIGINALNEIEKEIGGNAHD